LGVWLLFFFFLSASGAATLSQLYGYLLEQNEFLLTQQYFFFHLHENANHASDDYDKVNSRTEYFSPTVFFKLSPLKNSEINLGYAQMPPITYSRSTYDPDGELAVVQDYQLGYLRDFILQMRMRQGPFEPYIQVLERRQKSGWNSSLFPKPPDYFSYILSHYEDFSLGLRYLSGDFQENDSPESNLALLRRPLLNAGQLALDGQLRYRKAALRRNDYYYFTFFGSVFSVFYNFYQRLEPQYTPRIDLAYGLARNLEFDSGLEFSFPYKYHYKYQRVFLGTPLNILDGTYTLDQNFGMPLRLHYRPWQDIELLFSSDIAYCHQKLGYWSEAGGIKTFYDDKKLEYFNTQPALTLEYLYGAGKTIAPDEFSRLTKNLLSGGQFLLKFKYLRDITVLDKNDANGAQNRIDPYNVFINPLDLFVAGTEYAATFTGNKSDTATNVAAQNYNLFQLAFTYGFTERFNIGAVAGYRTASRFHHFVLAPTTSSFSLLGRAYVLKPYWFFSVPLDWRLTKNSLVSLAWYYVPHYRTSIDIDTIAKDFKSKTKYQSISFSFKILF
jgi:hypothetical protein